MKRGLVDWGPAFVCALLIFYVSHQSEPPGKELAPAYLGHLVEYAVFALTLIWSFSRHFQRTLSRQSIVRILSVSTLYAVLDEGHQAFVPGRTSSWQDILVDFCGAALAVWAFQLWTTGRKGRKSS